MDGDTGSAKRYRQRAMAVRAEAEKLTNPEAKQTLIEIADSYEKLAYSLDARTRRDREDSN
jgi:hypothetical protein